MICEDFFDPEVKHFSRLLDRIRGQIKQACSFLTESKYANFPKSEKSLILKIHEDLLLQEAILVAQLEAMV